MSALDELDIYVPLAVVDIVHSLEAENERLRADAERYVWIFNNCEVTYYKHDLPFATEADLDAAMKDGK